MRNIFIYALTVWWALAPLATLKGIGFTQFFGAGVAAGGGAEYVLKDSNTGTSTGSNNVTFGSASRMVATAFTATATYTLARVDVYVATVGAPNRDVTCEIWSTTGTTPNAMIGSASAAVNTTTFPGSEGTVTFYPSASITSGTTYHIVLKSTTSNSSNYFVWHRTNTATRIDQSNNSTISWSNLSTSSQSKFAAYAFE